MHNNCSAWVGKNPVGICFYRCRSCSLFDSQNIKEGFYWVQLGGGKVEMISSLLARVIIKLITDFTTLVQFRHPQELGGAYWTISFS